MRGSGLLEAFSGRTKELPLGLAERAKSLWAATGLDGKRTAGKGRKGTRGPQQCVQGSKGRLSPRARAAPYPMTRQRDPRVGAIFQFPPKQNCATQRGGSRESSPGGQRACQSWRGVRRVVGTQTRVQWLFGNPNSQAHPQWRNAWLMAQGEQTNNIEVKSSWWYQKKKKQQRAHQSEKATTVNVRSHGH